MRVPVELDPDVDDEAPTGDTITVYDERHFVTYLRLLDAKSDGADWREAAQIVLHRDPVADERRTFRYDWEYAGLSLKLIGFGMVTEASANEQQGKDI